MAGALLVVISGFATPAVSQPLAHDSGAFDIFIDGQRSGTEEFEIKVSGAGASAQVYASSHSELSSGERLDSRLRAVGVGAAPTDYQLSIAGESPIRILATIGAGRVQAKNVTASGEQLREYVASPGAVLIDDGIVHHYQLLAARSHGGRVPVLIPRQNRQILVTIEDRGAEVVEIAGARTTLSHLVARPPGERERHLWLDAAGRLMRLEIPALAYRADRR